MWRFNGYVCDFWPFRRFSFGETDPRGSSVMRLPLNFVNVGQTGSTESSRARQVWRAAKLQCTSLFAVSPLSLRLQSITRKASYVPCIMYIVQCVYGRYIMVCYENAGIRLWSASLWSTFDLQCKDNRKSIFMRRSVSMLNRQGNIFCRFLFVDIKLFKPT